MSVETRWSELKQALMAQGGHERVVSFLADALEFSIIEQRFAARRKLAETIAAETGGVVVPLR